MNSYAGLLRLIVFPGLIFAVPAAWLFQWGERKTIAKMQRRTGPPVLQPLYDFVKLFGKRTPARHGMEGALLKLWPALSVASMVGALGLLPVFPKSGGFSGDVILLVTLLELPSMCFILAGFTSGSLFGEIGSAREAVMSVANNLVFLMAIVTIAVTEHTFRLADLAGPSTNPGHWIGVFGILICIPAKLRLNPFSSSSAEQEIYSGPLTEYAGAGLAMWELAHGLEWVALTGLVATLMLPRTGVWWLEAPLFVILAFLEMVLLAGFSAATARLTLSRSIRFYWRWALILAVLAMSSAAYLRMKP